MNNVQQIISLLPLLGMLLISLISPGPDFAIVVKNSLVYSRRSGLLTALGIATAILIHITYMLLGFGVLITHTPLLLHLVQYVGAGYLFYIGYKNVLSKAHSDKISGRHVKEDIPAIQAFRAGFITCLLNPKAILFFISLFSVLMPEGISAHIKVLLAVVLFIETLCWFSFVAFCLSGKKTRETFGKISHWIERVTGCILMLLALKLLFTRLA